MKKGYKDSIEKLTLKNKAFRHVVYTAKHCQLVVMSLLPGQDIGLEVHKGVDQFFRFEKGKGKVIINKTEYHVTDGDAIIVPAGSRHNVINTSKTAALKLYTVYAPPHHKDGIVRQTKEEAIADAPEFKGVTTE